jgi:non-haem Fe2+, alpha-ketoglutarate-dependent halogenase
MAVQARTATSGLKSLTPEAVAKYERDGFYYPIRVMSEADARALRKHLETHEASAGGPLKGSLRHKSHLLFTWLWDLVHHPKVLDAVEDVLGPNLLCWSSSFFIKEARDPGYVSWHQDATYWGLSSPDVITAWIALSPSTIEAGAMRVVPGSQASQVGHRDTFNQHNMLTRGQEVMVDVDGKDAVDLVLRPGEMSLHHVRIIHGSEPNRSDDRRIGFAVRYIPTSVRQIAGPRDSATLVRGTDTYNNFDHEPRPEHDMSAAALALHQSITERQAQILYRGTDTKSFDKVVRS